MRPQARTVPVDLCGERSFKIDHNAMAAFQENTGKSMYTLLAQLKQYEIEMRPYVAEYQQLSKQKMTPEIESRMAEIDLLVSKATDSVPPKLAIVAIWAGLQHQWLTQVDGTLGMMPPLTIEQVGANINPQNIGNLMIRLQAAFLPPDSFPDKLLDELTKEGAGEDPLSEKAGSNGVPGPSPEPASESVMPSTEH